MIRRNNIILIILVFFFFLLFFYNLDIKMSVIDSINIWLDNLIPSMIPMYLTLDLLLNYGLSNIFYKVFKSNNAILILISMLLGTPSNAKYISDFYRSGYIDEVTANYLMTFSYSPNPLFILAITPDTKTAIEILIFIYTTNLIIACLFYRRKKTYENNERHFETKSFTETLESSIYKSFKISVLILGIIIVYGIINTILDLLVGPNMFIKSTLELTNAMSSMLFTGNTKYYLFAVSFGGLSIHTQIKSILEDTPIKYKYFLYGRLIASVLALIVTFVF